MKRNIIYSLILAILVVFITMSYKASRLQEPTEKEKVLKLAEKIAFKTYGDTIKDELPLKAELVGDSIWVVNGTLPEGMVGGTVHMKIDKNTHKVLEIIHYK